MMNDEHKKAILAYLRTMPQTVSYRVDIGEDEIHVTWQKAKVRAIAVFDEENEYGYTYYQNGHFTPGQKQVSIGDAWPDDLLSYLHSNDHD
jgi:hypothetical protein